MANSEDSDQTAPSGAVWSGSALFAYAILPEALVYEIFGHLPYPRYIFNVHVACKLEYHIALEMGLFQPKSIDIFWFLRKGLLDSFFFLEF